ncbi:MAG: hypothetical protein KBI44_20440 [Thermoanaerobaculia bacterium]|nr:hypothetical protein [Thermoanaerobaculia bacterium]
MEAGPVWVAQATWDLRERHLVAADPVAGEVFVFDRKGRIVRRLARPGQGPLDFPRPAYPFVVGNRYLVGSRLTRWVWMDSRFAPVEAMPLEWEDPSSAEYRELSFNSFDAGSTKFVGVGEVQSHDLTWSRTGMFAVSYRSPGQLENLGSIEADSDESAAFRSYPSKVAACGDEVYLLRMKSRLEIERFGDSPGSLRSFPEIFRQRPALPMLHCGPSVPEREAAKAVARIAEGLFCLEDRWLLLLAHQPRADGGNQWLVYPVDPIADVLGEAIELPTRAAEIVFVAGKKRWAVLEKGPMGEVVGDQSLTRVISFPRPELTFLRR